MDTPLVKRAYNLGLKVVPNFLTLSEEQIQYYENNLDQIQEAILRGFVIPEKKVITETTRAWREEGNVIYFSVTSDGTTGEEWIKRLLKKNYRVGDYAKSILRSKDFKPTKGVTTEIAVLKGMLFTDDERITKKIRIDASNRKLETPNAEIACLIREKFTDEEIEAMGLTWIVAMHEPIKDSDGEPDLLSADRNDDGRWLDTYYDKPDDRCCREHGFAFAVSQVSA